MALSDRGCVQYTITTDLRSRLTCRLHDSNTYPLGMAATASNGLDDTCELYPELCHSLKHIRVQLSVLSRAVLVSAEKWM